MNDWHQIAVAYISQPSPWWHRLNQRYNDRMKQDMLNNLFSNNPGELDRWADDGGPVNDD